MINSGSLLALTGNQTLMVIAGGAVALLVIIFLCFKAMSRPVPGYQAHEEPVAAVEPPELPDPAPPVEQEKSRSTTPGFVLPLPSQIPPSLAATDRSEPLAAPVGPPPPVAPLPVEKATPSMERTVDLNRTPVEAKGFAPRETAAPGVSAAPDRSLLVFRNGSRQGEKVRLDSFADGQCAIGRSEVPENQIVIRDDLKISRVRHAIVTCESPGRYTIRDNNSANKVFVNDQCIENAPVALKHGDTVRIGLTELEYLKEPVS